MIFPEDYINHPVRSLQTMLQVLSTIFSDLPNVNPDGIYGQSTKNAVSAFQRRVGLPATGLADNTTWNHLADNYLRHAPKVLPPEPLRIVWQPMQTIAPGEKNLHLYLIQAMMAALGTLYAGANPPAVTGVYDAATERAVLRLQARFGLPQTGIIDQRFWGYLTRLYTISAGNGAVRADAAPTFAPSRYLL